MKKIVKIIIIIFVDLFSKVYTYSINEKLKNFYNVVIYTRWISKSFKSFGENSIISKGLILYGAKYINIGNNVNIGERVVLSAWSKYAKETFNPIINIGNNVSIGDDCHITSINLIEIGDNVLFGKKITITDNTYGDGKYESIYLEPKNRGIYSPGSVKIENNVWIGDKVTILPNVRIGANAIIGANAVVTKDIPSFSIAVGIPAKVIMKSI